MNDKKVEEDESDLNDIKNQLDNEVIETASIITREKRVEMTAVGILAGGVGLLIGIFI